MSEPDWRLQGQVSAPPRLPYIAWVKRVNRKWWLLVVVLCASCTPMHRACAESNHDLTSDSRLPGWFLLPPGLTRSDVSVKFTTYVSLSQGLFGLYDLVDGHGRIISTVTGRPCVHPASPNYPADSGIWFATINGITEVFEHHARPITSAGFFRLSDDPELVRQAKESVTRGQCVQSN